MYVYAFVRALSRLSSYPNINLDDLWMVDVRTDLAQLSHLTRREIIIYSREGFRLPTSFWEMFHRRPCRRTISVWTGDKQRAHDLTTPAFFTQCWCTHVSLNMWERHVSSSPSSFETFSWLTGLKITRNTRFCGNTDSDNNNKIDITYVCV